MDARLEIQIRDETLRDVGAKPLTKSLIEEKKDEIQTDKVNAKFDVNVRAKGNTRAMCQVYMIFPKLNGVPHPRILLTPVRPS